MALLSGDATPATKKTASRPKEVIVAAERAAKVAAATTTPAKRKKRRLSPGAEAHRRSCQEALGGPESRRSEVTRSQLSQYLKC
jgi:hypothetical protein